MTVIKGKISSRKKYPIITAKGALVVNIIPVRRGPSRFRVTNIRVSPIRIPIIEDRLSTQKALTLRVCQPPLHRDMEMRVRETIIKRRRLNLTAPRVRAGVVENRPPHDQHKAAARAENSAIYMVSFWTGAYFFINAPVFN